MAAYTIPPSSKRKRIRGQAKLPADKDAREYIRDAIMANSPPTEPFELSLSRLASAAAWAGYETLCPTAVFVCYRIFGSILNSPYKHKHGKRTGK